jgi:uncharacterized membrane protein YGL010W
MKTQQEWFDEYAVSHQNTTNQRIHYICVPLIFFSIVGMIMCIPSVSLNQVLGFEHSIFVNWATILLLLLMIFYIRMSIKTFFLMFLFSLLSLYVNQIIFEFGPLLYISMFIFIIAWIGQFYGHKIEGKKPSFFKDIQFLLIGPAWVFEKLSR